MTDQDELGAEFETHRRRLVGVAYRMLGTLADAEDVVQDAWLRLARTDRRTILDLPAWLTTVTSRLWLDRLRSAQVTRELYVGPWLPEPVVQGLDDGPPGPADLAETDESIRMALLVVLEELTPEQRIAFVLHDLFAVPFDEVAAVLGTSGVAARQLASRARRTAQGAAPAGTVSLDRQRDVVTAFYRAAAGGDLTELMRRLAPDVVLRSDGGGAVRAALRPVHGADKVARFAAGLIHLYPGARVEAEPVLVNGELGLVVRVFPGGAAGATDDAPDVSVIVPHVGSDELIHGIDIVRNPAKLRRLDDQRRLGGAATLQ